MAFEKILCTSDQHFGHRKIIDLEGRPFKDLNQMDTTIIKNWNKVVKKCDKVIILGDFSFYNKDKTVEIVNSLNGYKILIMGNHDRTRSRHWWLDAGFDEVHEDPFIKKEFYIFSHEPVYIGEGLPYINIHGHTHSRTYANEQYFNVCIEKTDYCPVDFNYILSKYSIMDK